MARFRAWVVSEEDSPTVLSARVGNWTFPWSVHSGILGVVAVAARAGLAVVDVTADVRRREDMVPRMTDRRSGRDNPESLTMPRAEGC